MVGAWGEEKKAGKGVGQGRGARAGQGRERGCQHLFKAVPPRSASETASLSRIFSLRVCQGREAGRVSSGHQGTEGRGQGVSARADQGSHA